MLIGLEYVVAAYVIWVFIFVVYILMTKYRMKTALDTINSIKRRTHKLSENPELTASNENKK